MAAAGDSRFKCQALKPMFEKRTFATAVQEDDIIYVIGGCDNHGHPIQDFECFNVKKGRWEKLCDLPTKRAGTVAAVVNHKIYVLSGVARNQEPLDAVEMYDIKEKRWTSLEQLKEKLLGVSAIVKDNNIYIVGGMTPLTTPMDYFMCLDTNINKWKDLRSMPTPRYATTSFLIDNKLYVLGGRKGKNPCGAFEVYDFEGEKWSELPAIPTLRVFAMYATNNTHIFCIGGLYQDQDNKNFSDECQIYDIAKGEWKTGSAMPTKRADFAIGVIGGFVVCAGGIGYTQKSLKTVEAYDPQSDSWTTLPELPSSHASCANLTSNDKMYVAGGLSLTGPNCKHFDVISMK